MINLTTALTGGAQTGFTTPGYTLTVDTPPDVNSKQSAITGVTGTQAGVLSHSVSNPFTITWTRFKTFAVLGKPNPVTGLIAVVPRNIQKSIVRKGVLVAAGQPYNVMLIKTEYSIPAGAETYDSANVRAACSANVGFMNGNSAGIGDTLVTGLTG